MLDRAFLSVPLAHRGLHDAEKGVPENSRAAMAAAVAAGHGIELDVQPSADGVAMVFHDATLDRLTRETGPIAARSAAELGRMPLRGSDETIPTLAEVLDLVAGRAPVLIEIKDQSGGRGDATEVLEAAVANVVAGRQGPLAVMSFNPASVAAMRRLAPDLPRGLTTGGFLPEDWPMLTPEACHALRSIKAFGAVGARFISHDWTDLGSPRVRELKAQGTPILCWTIRSAAMEAEARRVADNITYEGYSPAAPMA